MSEIFYEQNYKSWKKFTLTGSVYDYLDYKLNNFNKLKNSVNGTVILDNCGGFCEDRNKRRGN